jgi:hypothetical protein
MNILSRVVALLFLTVSMASCLSDDGMDMTAIQYRVTTETPMTTEITYKKVDGQHIQVQMPQETMVWHTTEYTDKDFEALVKASFSNLSDRGISYTLHLFVDGELVIKNQGTVLPNSQSASQASYTITK